MDRNHNISTILLLGFPNLHGYRFLLFCLLLLIFCVSLFGNTVIIILVYSKTLKSPMYFFLSQLSICDILLSIDSVPNALNVVLNEGGTISLTACIIQYAFFVISECLECYLLTVMSYDRYLAICNPMNYTLIMGDGLSQKLSIMTWSISIVYSFILSGSVSCLHFCGPNIIDHFFCELAPMLELSCSEVFTIQIEAKVLGVPTVVCPFLIMVSYVYIVNAVLNISSSSGRQKAFFTCSSHLTAVCLYYGTLVAVYMFPASLQSLTVNKIFTLIYAVAIPSLNPIIYSLRNKDVEDAFTHFTNKINCFL